MENKPNWQDIKLIFNNNIMDIECDDNDDVITKQLFVIPHGVEIKKLRYGLDGVRMLMYEIENYMKQFDLKSNEEGELHAKFRLNNKRIS